MIVAAARTLSRPMQADVFPQIGSRHVFGYQKSKRRRLCRHQMPAPGSRDCNRACERISCMKLAVGLGRGFVDRQYFYGHNAPHDHMFGLEHDSHAPLADSIPECDIAQALAL